MLLAAGAGTRFGMPKVLADKGEWLRIGGQRAARRRLRRRGRGAGRGDRRRACARPRRSSLLTGPTGCPPRCVPACRRSTRDYAVLHTVDTPDIGADVVRRVLAAARSSSSGLARARYGGAPGHPVVVARRHWPELRRAAARRRGRAAVSVGARRRRRGGLRRPGDRPRHRRQRLSRQSTSGDRQPQHRRGEPAHRLFGDRRGVGMAVSGAVRTVAASGSSRTSASISPVVGSQTAQVYPVSEPIARCTGRRSRVGLTHRGERGAVVDQVVSRGARKYQAPALISTGSTSRW